MTENIRQKLQNKAEKIYGARRNTESLLLADLKISFHIYQCRSEEANDYKKKKFLNTQLNKSILSDSLIEQIILQCQ